eukprot:5671616-Amphidinium_carterae.1
MFFERMVHWRGIMDQSVQSGLRLAGSWQAALAFRHLDLGTSRGHAMLGSEALQMDVRRT